MHNFDTLTFAQLKECAWRLRITGYTRMKRRELLSAVKCHPERDEVVQWYPSGSVLIC